MGSKRAAAVGAALVVAALLAGCSTSLQASAGDPGAPARVTIPDTKPVVAIPDGSATQGTALEVLERIAVKGRAPATGYDRSGKFGAAWLDVDHNGCDTRNDILARDLTTAAKRGRCTVVSGMLTDPYTGKTIDFVRGNKTSLAVQIDHVVALKDAWQSGAQQLTQAQRISLANDPINLMAVDGPTNQRKGAANAASWLPPRKSFRCSYVARQISVKATYGLWVTKPEHDAMARILAACPNEPGVTSSFAPAAATPAPAKPAPSPTATPPAPAPTPTPVVPAPAPAPVVPAPAPPAPPAPAPAPADVYYQNCTAVRAAGKAPLYRGEPGYAPKLDRDGDGVACE